MGLEIEHFIVHRDTGKTVTYYESEGIRDLLHWFETQGWTGQYEQGRIIGLSAGEKTITLEPGAQVEFSSSPMSSLDGMMAEYLDFYESLGEWTKTHNQDIRTCGYQPLSTIAEIPLIPKEKYRIMDTCLQERGEYAHHMMRGTGSTQLTVDFTGEADFVTKLRIAVRCTPVFALLFSNCPSFEGMPYKGFSIRSRIWGACDDERCGIIPGVFSENFGYTSLAEFLLDMKPMVYRAGGVYFPSGDRTFAELLEQFPSHDFEKTLHETMRMVFTDVRVKQFIELRMADALPADHILRYAALVKELFYNPATLAAADRLFQSIDDTHVSMAMKELPGRGYDTVMGGRTLRDWTAGLMDVVNAEPLHETKTRLAALREDFASELDYMPEVNTGANI